MSDSLCASDSSCKQCDTVNGTFDRFAVLREKRLLTDIVLTSSDGKRFPVHELVMAGASDYFYNRLHKTDINDNTTDFVPIDDPFRLDIHSSILEPIIQYCYMGHATIADDNISGVLAAAGTLQIQNLLALCCNALGKMLTPANCLQYLQTAKEHHMTGLTAKALEMVADNLIDVCKTKEFHRLSIPQMNWLLRKLSRTQNGLYDDLLRSLKCSESEFVTSMPQLFTSSDTLSIIRSAFIVGYFKGTQNSNHNSSLAYSDRSTGHNSCRRTSSDADSRYFHGGHKDPVSEHDEDDGDDAMEYIVENHANVIDAIKNAKTIVQKPTGIVVHMHKRDILFSTFCGMQHEWNMWPSKITVAHDIDTFKETVIHPIGRHIYVFYVIGGSISNVQQIDWEAPAVVDVLVPDDVKSFAAALFCLLNDEIYCFTRTEQNSYYKLNAQTNRWIFERIENAMDCKCMIGLSDELYFIGCGYHRTIVRSYNVLTRKWTARGGLKRSTQEDAIKAVTVNESIYVVLKCYDHSKIYNQTEFLVQTYDVEGNDWVAVKQIHATHFIDRFYLHAAGYFLYLFHEDAKVHVYNERAVEWSELPALAIPLPASAICITERNEEQTF